jgi:hypothetical protein
MEYWPNLRVEAVSIFECVDNKTAASLKGCGCFCFSGSLIPLQNIVQPFKNLAGSSLATQAHYVTPA